jgi:hypothetical protein
MSVSADLDTMLRIAPFGIFAWKATTAGATWRRTPTHFQSKHGPGNPQVPLECAAADQGESVLRLRSFVRADPNYAGPQNLL